ncbi:hypothetical protein BH23GEM9_BH23GEM9_14600 [soil metagenome]
MPHGGDTTTRNGPLTPGGADAESTLQESKGCRPTTGGHRSEATSPGRTLLALGVLVLTGVDKYLEALAVGLVPAWVFTL